MRWALLVRTPEEGGDAVSQAGRAEVGPVALGGDCESIGDFDAERRELANHLPERGVLAAHRREIVQPEILEPGDVGHEGRLTPFSLLGAIPPIRSGEGRPKVQAGCIRMRPHRSTV